MRLACCLVILAAAAPVVAAPYEPAPARPVVVMLDAADRIADGFHVLDPVRSDGMLNQYEVDTRFGLYRVEGDATLARRRGEFAALAAAARISDLSVVSGAITANIGDQLQTVAQAARDPVGLVTGIPQGIGHLFEGAAAQLKELTRRDPKPATTTNGSKTDQAVDAARRYAVRYLGVTGAERRWAQRLGVDPYTDNEPLRQAIHHLAKVDATTHLGLRFVPGVPYAGDVRRAMDAVYQEDPAVLRARRRTALLGYGLSPVELGQFENDLRLTPTRQERLAALAAALEDVAERAALFRGATGLGSDSEAVVYLDSVGLLVGAASETPLARIVAGPRLPTAETRDGRIVVAAAVDAIYWTEKVAEDFARLRHLVPVERSDIDLILGGEVSPNAEQGLRALGFRLQTPVRARTP
jgi:hypothetical protein